VAKEGKSESPFGLFSIHLGLSIVVDKEQLIMFVLHSDTLFFFKIFFFFPMWVAWGLGPNTNSSKEKKA
jgi:hypothetical protein